MSKIRLCSFVVFTSAIQSNLLDKTTGQLLTLAVIISMILTPFILKKISYLVNLVFKSKTNDKITVNVKTKLKNHIVVCGYGNFAKQILTNLDEYQTPYNVLIDNYEFFEKAVSKNVPAIFGNPAQKQILEEAGIKDAKVVIIAIHDVKQIELIYHAVRSVHKDIKIITKVTNKKIFDSSIDTKDFIDIYSFTSGLISTQAFAYIHEDTLLNKT